MNKEDILNQLKLHLEKVKDTANFVYIKKLKITIKLLEDNAYTSDQDLVDDLRSLGFGDLAFQYQRSFWQ